MLVFGLYIRYLFAYCIQIMDTQRENGALLIAASIVAAIRLRGEAITRSPKVLCAVSDSVQLAKLVWREILRSRDSGQ